MAANEQASADLSLIAEAICPPAQKHTGAGSLLKEREVVEKLYPNGWLRALAQGGYLFVGLGSRAAMMPV